MRPIHEKTSKLLDKSCIRPDEQTLMSNEIFFDGLKYISAGDASETTGLSRDYIARLCRDGKLRGRRVGKNWYVDEESLRRFGIEQEHQKAVRRVQLSEERVREYRGAADKPQSLKLQVESEKATAVTAVTSHESPVTPKVAQPVAPTAVTKTFAAHAKHVQDKLAAAALAQSARVAHAMPSIAAAPSGVHEAVARTLSHAHVHVPVYTLTPAAEFLQKFVAIFVAFTMTFGTYAFVDPAYARFAVESARGFLASTTESLARIDDAADRAMRVAHSSAYFAAENPEVALAQVSSATLAFIPNALQNLARSFNTSVDTFVYNILFSDGATNSLALTPLDPGFVDATAPYERAQQLAAQTSVPPTVATSTTTVITNERIVERIIETERIVAAAGGINDADLELRLSALEQRLTGLVAGVSTAQTTSVNNVYQTVALTNKIDQLSSVDISDSTITGGTLSGVSLSDISFSGTATTTFANGIDLADGCFAVDGACITGGGGSVDTSVSNNWTALQIFSGGASSTNFSNFGTAYFGGSATTTIDSTGALSLANLTNSLLWVNGSGTVAATTTPTAAYFIATSTSLASSFPYASSTALSVSGTAFFPGSGIWDSSGNVGVGDTTPSYALDVNGVVATNNYFFNTNTAATQVLLNSGTTYYGNIQNESGSPDRWSLGYGTTNTTALKTPVLTWTSGGNVGIGTSTPWAKFSIANSTGDTAGQALFTISSSTASATTTLFHVANSGNVGVGTSSPMGLFSVSGQMTSDSWCSNTLSVCVYPSSGFFAIRNRANSAYAPVSLANVYFGDANVYVGGAGITDTGSTLTVGGNLSAHAFYDKGNTAYYLDPAAATSLIVAGKVGVGTTSPLAKFAVHANNGETNTRLFEIASSTASATTTHFVVTNSGNVGVGTASPSGKLHVENGRFLATRSSNSKAAHIASFGSSASAGNSLIIYGGNNSGDPMYIGTDYWSSDGQLRLGTYTTPDTIALATNGNVGIGTTDPQALLQVRKNQAASTWVSVANSNAGGTAGYQIGYTSAGEMASLYSDMATNDLYLKNVATGGDFRVLVEDTTEALTILNTGNVGIGTTTPGSLLNLYGTGSGTELRIDNGGADGDPFVSFALSGTQTWIAGIDDSDSDTFKINATSGNFNTTGLAITTSGNVGIGTASPQGGLSVASALTSTSPSVVGWHLGTTGGTTNGLESYNTAATYLDFSSVSERDYDFRQIFTASTNDLQFISSSTNPILTLKGTGNVGIGTVSPATALHMLGNFRIRPTGASTDLNILLNSSDLSIEGTGSLRLSSSGSSLKYTVGASGVGEVDHIFYGGGSTAVARIESNTQAEYARLSLQSGTANNFSQPYFTITSNGGSTGNIFTLNSAGNVGVGTTTPWAKFSIANNTGDTAGQALFSISSSTASATTTLFHVANSGNVGIGTASPSYGLDVTGTGRLTSTFAWGTSGATYMYTIGGTQRYGYSTANANVLYSGGSGGLTIWNQADSSELVRITDSGNVGIGTTSPYKHLSISSSANSDTSVVIANTHASFSAAVSSTYQTATKRFDAGLLGNSNSVAPNSYYIYDSNNDAFRFIVGATGNIGVGTTSPTNKLSIESNTATIGGLAENLRVAGDQYEVGIGLANYGSGGNTWSLMATRGNSSFGGAKFLIADSAANRFAIDSSGNVGIGTTSPLTKLSVQGTAGDNDVFNVASSTGASMFYVDSSGKVGVGTMTPDYAFTVSGTAATYASVQNSADEEAGIFFSTAANGGNGWALFMDGSNVNDLGATHRLGFYSTDLSATTMTLDGVTGNVGIGTTTPYSKLTAWGGASGNIFEAVTSASTTALRIAADGFATTTLSGLSISGSATSTSNVGFNLTAGCFSINGTCVGGGSGSGTVGSGTTGWFPYYAGDGTTLTATSSIFLATSGKIGIGTTTPRRGLSVVSSSAADTNAEFTSTANDGFGGFNIYNNFGTLVTSLVHSNAGASVNASSTWFGTRNDESLHLVTNGATPRLTIDSSGDVGIGTTTPRSLLHVAGTDLSSFTGTSNGLLTVDGTSGNNSYYQAIDFNASVVNGRTTPLARIASQRTGSGSYLYFGTSNSYASGITNTALTINPSGNVGIGTTTPYAKLTVWGSGTGTNPLSEWVDSASTTIARILENGTAYFAGNLGVGTTSPFRKFSVTAAAANPQVAISYDDSTVASLQVDSTGDLIVTASGQNVLLNDDNMLVCASGCPTSPTGAGKLYVETAAGIGTTTPAAKLTIETQDSSTNFIQVASTTAQSIFVINANGNVGVGTSTPFAKFTVGANGAIATVENSLSDGATVAINWRDGNQQKVVLGGNRTITFSNFIAGQILRLVVCQDGTGSRTLTWPAVVRWQGGSAPTLTTTANSCDLVSFVATNATSSLVVFGAAALDF